MALLQQPRRPHPPPLQCHPVPLHATWKSHAFEPIDCRYITQVSVGVIAARMDVVHAQYVEHQHKIGDDYGREDNLRTDSAGLHRSGRLLRISHIRPPSDMIEENQPHHQREHHYQTAIEKCERPQMALQSARPRERMSCSREQATGDHARPANPGILRSQWRPQGCIRQATVPLTPSRFASLAQASLALSKRNNRPRFNPEPGRARQDQDSSPRLFQVPNDTIGFHPYPCPRQCRRKIELHSRLKLFFIVDAFASLRLRRRFRDSRLDGISVWRGLCCVGRFAQTFEFAEFREVGQTFKVL
jgi:hypothetical protein